MKRKGFLIVDNFILHALMFEKKGILKCEQFYTVCFNVWKERDPELWTILYCVLCFNGGQFYTVCCVLMFEKEGILNFDLYTCNCCCVNYCKFLKASFDILEREESILFCFYIKWIFFVYTRDIRIAHWFDCTGFNSNSMHFSWL